MRLTHLIIEVVPWRNGIGMGSDRNVKELKVQVRTNRDRFTRSILIDGDHDFKSYFDHALEQAIRELKEKIGEME